MSTPGGPGERTVVISKAQCQERPAVSSPHHVSSHEITGQRRDPCAILPTSIQPTKTSAEWLLGRKRRRPGSRSDVLQLDSARRRRARAAATDPTGAPKSVSTFEAW